MDPSTKGGRASRKAFVLTRELMNVHKRWLTQKNDLPLLSKNPVGPAWALVQQEKKEQGVKDYL